MNKSISFWKLGWLILGLALTGGRGWAAEEWPKFSEVYDLIRSHLIQAKDKELNQAAIEGFLRGLYPQVSLEPPISSLPASSLATNLSLATVYEGDFAYLRIHRVGAGLEDQVVEALTRLRTTNALKGLVLDLRFAGGQDYAAAAKVANLFVATERPLVSWGDTTLQSTTKTNALTLPVMIVVNRKTAGAAEALAAVVRQTDLALIIGANTAGQACQYQEFSLRTGQRLWIATAAIKVGREVALPLNGLSPDIRVTVKEEEEKAYYDQGIMTDAKDWLAGRERRSAVRDSSANASPRQRLNEADLVRMQMGQDADGSAPEAGAPLRPTVQDPALARAFDLLKGLAVISLQDRR